jgi:hypothetical protein
VPLPRNEFSKSAIIIGASRSMQLRGSLDYQGHCK